MSVTLHTSVGDLKLEVQCELVPRAAENFLALCASGKYNGTKFHRSVPGFLLQGGDTSGTGKGGESIWSVPFEDEIVPSLTHCRRGVFSMANSGKDQNGSQFFISYSKQPLLDGKYSIFGQLVGGWETLEAIEQIEVGKKHRPVKDVVIQSVTIHANPLAQ